jgi:hypothetical protein
MLFSNSSFHPIPILIESEKEFSLDSFLKFTKQVRRRKVLLPRVVKTDIRLLYSRMFTNMLNLYNYDLCEGFFREFCIPDLLFSSSTKDELHTSLDLDLSLVDSHSSLIIESASSAAQFLFGSLLSTPDINMTINNSRFIQLPGTDACKIEFRYVFKATKIYKENIDFSMLICDPQDETNLLNDDQQSYSINCISHHGHKTAVRCKSYKQVYKSLQKLQLCQHPCEVTLSGKFVLTVNEEKVISQIVMIVDTDCTAP